MGDSLSLDNSLHVLANRYENSLVWTTEVLSEYKLLNPDRIFVPELNILVCSLTAECVIEVEGMVEKVGQSRALL